MKNKDQICFKIDQLRKDKIIYGVEAIAVNSCCLFAFIFINFNYFSDQVRILGSNLLLIIAVVYTIFMGVGNFLRLQKIKKLEKILSKKPSD